MDRSNKKGFLAITFLIGIFIIASCETLQYYSGENGYLEGTISIGPICPVQTVPPEPACLPTAETYKSYPVNIWTADGKKKIKQINPALNGSYRTELTPGNYLVVLDRGAGNFGGSNLPLNVSIIAKKYTILNIDIDTGIR
jgi:hypothetical protein